MFLINIYRDKVIRLTESVTVKGGGDYKTIVHGEDELVTGKPEDIRETMREFVWALKEDKPYFDFGVECGKAVQRRKEKEGEA